MSEWHSLFSFRYKKQPKWGKAVWYGKLKWPSHSIWIIPGTIGPLS